jgi:hypothetical protein
MTLSSFQYKFQAYHKSSPRFRSSRLICYGASVSSGKLWSHPFNKCRSMIKHHKEKKYLDCFSNRFWLVADVVGGKKKGRSDALSNSRRYIPRIV